MDSKESPLQLPNENTIAEKFLERNFHLFIDTVINTDGEDSKDFQVESEKDLFGIREEAFDSENDPLSFVTNGIKEENSSNLIPKCEIKSEEFDDYENQEAFPFNEGNYEEDYEVTNPFLCDICNARFTAK